MGTAGGFIVLVGPPGEPSPAAAAARDDQAAAIQLFAEKSAVGFFDLSLKTGNVTYSPAWKRMLGYSDAELSNTYEVWLGLIHPEDSAAAPDKVGRKLKEGSRPFSVEFRMKHRLGHWIWIQCVGLQVVSEAGELERVIGMNIDATERKEVEEAGLAGDARLHALADDGPLAAFEVDFSAGTSWFSEAWARLMGASKAPAEGQGAIERALGPEECPDGLRAWLLLQAPGKPSFSIVAKLHTDDGRTVPVVLGISRSMTRRRTVSSVSGFACPLPDTAIPAPAAAAEKAPAGAFSAMPAALLTEMLSALSEGVIAVDADGKVLLANPTAARIVGQPMDSLTGKPLDQVFALVDRLTGKPGDSPAERALTSNGTLPLISDHAVNIQGRSPVPVVWTARACFGEDSRPNGVVVVFRDPEEMGLTPEELIKANRFESLGLLAGGIAHDFNNLLTTILGGLSLAKDNRDLSRLADSEKACMTAKGLTKQLLLFAKGGKSVQTVCNAREILDDAVKIASAGSTAEITVEVPEGTGAVTVDRGQILQVFQNLIVNSLQAMPPAPHRARLQLRAADARLEAGQLGSLPEGGYVEFQVRDNGSGIKPEHLEKIWDPFFTTKKNGTGLGLATVLSIVRKHGGEIGLQSTVGEGTVFTICLPLADKPVEVQARPAPSLRFGTGRVLFMDDDTEICALTGSMLESLDYKYDIAKNGDEAITLYKRYLNIGRPYDAVIMDLTVIGGMGGEEAFRLLKELDGDVRAIVSSGYDNEDMARQYLDIGFCGYLTKPYRVTDLGKVLKAVLG
jgi:PAS domain S-box-containing protein